MNGEAGPFGLVPAVLSMSPLVLQQFFESTMNRSQLAPIEVRRKTAWSPSPLPLRPLGAAGEGLPLLFSLRNILALPSQCNAPRALQRNAS
jgi:hypothetical protein